MRCGWPIRSTISFCSPATAISAGWSRLLHGTRQGIYVWPSCWLQEAPLTRLTHTWPQRVDHSNETEHLQLLWLRRCAGRVNGDRQLSLRKGEYAIARRRHRFRGGGCQLQRHAAGLALVVDGLQLKIAIQLLPVAGNGSTSLT